MDNRIKGSLAQGLAPYATAFPRSRHAHENWR